MTLNQQTARKLQKLILNCFFWGELREIGIMFEISEIADSTISNVFVIFLALTPSLSLRDGHHLAVGK